MTVKLTGNFLATARCLIFQDASGIAWAFNSETNQLTATTGGSGGGISGTITTAKLTSGGANGSMTFTNGVLTAQTAAT